MARRRQPSRIELGACFIGEKPLFGDGGVLLLPLNESDLHRAIAAGAWSPRFCPGQCGFGVCACPTPGHGGERALDPGCFTIAFDELHRHCMIILGEDPRSSLQGDCLEAGLARFGNALGPGHDRAVAIRKDFANQNTGESGSGGSIGEPGDIEGNAFAILSVGPRCDQPIQEKSLEVAVGHSLCGGVGTLGIVERPAVDDRRGALVSSVIGPGQAAREGRPGVEARPRAHEESELILAEPAPSFLHGGQGRGQVLGAKFLHVAADHMGPLNPIPALERPGEFIGGDVGTAREEPCRVLAAGESDDNESNAK